MESVEQKNGKKFSLLLLIIIMETFICQLDQLTDDDDNDNDDDDTHSFKSLFNPIKLYGCNFVI